MSVDDLRTYLEHLERHGCLKRVRVPVNPVLEVPEILRRVMYRRGPAVLFENVAGYEGFRIAGNIFCSLDMVKAALGVEKLEDIGWRLFKPLQGPPPMGIGEKLRGLGEILSLIHI